MKMVAFILSFVILSLAVKPGMETLFLQADMEQSCCGGVIAVEDECQDTEEDADCTQGSCNPFSICNSCTIVFMKVSFQYTLSPQSHILHSYSYKPSFVSQFSVDFWQPPKIG